MKGVEAEKKPVIKTHRNKEEKKMSGVRELNVLLMK